ncbi:MAG: hypothetical protein ABFS03_00870 [Chloroflexota bacterium]
MAGGRPKFKIDYDQVEKLANLQCTQEEIASYLGCSVDTLQRDAEFCGIYKRGMDKGRMSLRRKQWKAAEDGDRTMLVWLGKQYLRQSDKQDINKNVTIYDASELSDSELANIATAGSTGATRQTNSKKVTH